MGKELIWDLSRIRSSPNIKYARIFSRILPYFTQYSTIRCCLCDLFIIMNEMEFLQAMYMTIHISLHPIILMMFLNCIIKTPLNYLYGSLLAKGNLRVINTIFFQMNHGNSKANENS